MANPGLHAMRLMLIGSILCLPFLGHRTDLVRGLDEHLIAERLAAAPRDATGAVALVAIDKASLDAVATWPWPRSLYGALVDRLTEAGAEAIFIDVDFSTPSQPDEDTRFAAALERAGGGVLLPVFRQQARAGAGSPVEINRPIATLLDHAWPAFANVAPDGDGAVRFVDLGDTFEGAQTQTAAAALAGTDRDTGRLRIDYSIRPESVPTFSVSDVLAGKIDAAALAGKAVVVGATATELKDIFSVPVYGALPGPMIHALAAETLIQNRWLSPVDQTAGELVLALLVIACALAWRSQRVAVLVVACVLLVTAGEAIAFYLLREKATILATAVPWLTLALGIVLLVNERFDFVRALMTIAHVENRNTRRLMKRIVADSSDGVIAFDSRLRIMEANAAARRILEGDIEIGRSSLLDHAAPLVADQLRALLVERQRDPDRIFSTRIDFTRANGMEPAHYEAAITLSPAEAESGRSFAAHAPFAGCLIVRDITARQLYHERLRQLSERDDLTGLLNRRAFVDRLPEAAPGTRIAVLDIENYASVCATFGREVGEEFLKAVARRLTSKSADGLIARLGGDVFAIALSVEESTEPGSVSDMILNWLDMPLKVGAASIEAMGRVGLCRLSEVEVDQAIGAAESALDEARKTPGCRWKAYDPACALRQARYRMLETDMRQALGREEFFLLYQPQVDLKTGQLIGAEALVRWQHPELGLVSPSDFIPIAESNGFICELGRWALETACREACDWPDDLTVAVNVSPVQLDRSHIVDDVVAALETTGLDPGRLCVEITESSFLESGQSILTDLGRLRTMGLRIALDDFGTGYSSMSYLSGIPLDKLKLDQSFVKKMVRDEAVREIVSAIISLAHALGLTVVAEGIEGDVERDMLSDLGCEVGQGYRFGRPLKSKPLLALRA